MLAAPSPSEIQNKFGKVVETLLRKVIENDNKGWKNWLSLTL